jgi:hypothetical protein
MIKENEEQKAGKTNHTAENLESVGQMIIGGLEQIGGILTGDPTTRAEGEFNAEVGNRHQESNKVLTAIENKEEARPNSRNETDGK